MMKKIFGKFLDKRGSGVEEVCAFLGVGAAGLKAVQVVSQHMRLFGVLSAGAKQDRLVVANVDNESTSCSAR